MHCRHHTHHGHYKSNSRFANIWTYYHKSTKFACKIVPVMNPRSRAPPASNVNKGIPGLLGLPLHVVDCNVNTGRRRQITMPALIKFPVCIRHHGGNTREWTWSSIGKVWPYLDFKGKKQKEALDHILDHCFDKICDVIVSLPIGCGKCLAYSLLPHVRGGT